MSEQSCFVKKQYTNKRKNVLLKVSKVQARKSFLYIVSLGLHQAGKLTAGKVEWCLLSARVIVVLKALKSPASRGSR